MSLAGRHARLNALFSGGAINRPAAPGAVRKELQNVMDLLLMQPDIGTPVGEAGSSGVRRFHVERIRFWLYYRVR